MQAAQRYYAAGNSKVALQWIEQAIRVDPSNAAAHYLLANCLVKMGQFTEANREYSVAEKLAPHSLVAQYSRLARTQLSTTQTMPLRESKSAARILDADLSDNDDAESANTSTGNKVNKNDSGKSANLSDRDKLGKQSATAAGLPPGTLELIRKQAALAKRMAVENGAAEAESERQKGAYEARSLQEKAERMAARPAGSNEPINLSTEDRERIKADAAVTGERLKQIGNWKASIVEEWSHEKSDEIQRQAENLQEQLIDSRRGNVKLNPVGTNLYIRNYSKPPLTPLRAEARSISTGTTSTLSSKQTGLSMHTNSATKSSSTNNRSHAVVKVEGKVLESH